MSNSRAWIKTLSLAAIVATVAAGAWNSPARADINDIYASDNSAEIRVGGQHTHYRESEGGATLDTENGWMTSLGGGASFLSHNRMNSFWNNIYVRFDGQFTFGDTDYDGSLQPSGTPYKGITKSLVDQLNVKLGYAFPVNNNLMAIPYVDIGYHYWRREMTGAYGYTEHYDHTYIMAGALLQYSPAPRWIYSLSLQGGTTISPQMRTGGVDYDLDERATWATSGRVSYAVSQRVEAFGEAGYSEFSYGKSAPDANSIYEPDSATREIKTLVGVAYRF